MVRVRVCVGVVGHVSLQVAHRPQLETTQSTPVGAGVGEGVGEGVGMCVGEGVGMCVGEGVGM